MYPNSSHVKMFLPSECEIGLGNASVLGEWSHSGSLATVKLNLLDIPPLLPLEEESFLGDIGKHGETQGNPGKTWESKGNPG